MKVLEGSEVRAMKFWKGLKILLMVAVMCVVAGFVVMHLWNWLMPSIFGLRAITFAQAIGLLVLSKLLLGGFHRHSGGGGHRWKRHMKEHWERMTPEERERFRSGMRGRDWCRFGGSDVTGAEQSAR
jgi:hypothetical protein